MDLEKAMIPITIIVPCPECSENPIIDPDKPCPVCRGEPIRICARPWERHGSVPYYDDTSVAAYIFGVQDGLRCAKQLRERIPSPLYTSNAIMEP